MSVDIVIRYNGTDITDSVMFETCNFTAQLNALPGTFEFTVRDMEQTHSFITGKEVTLDIDGVRLWGGYLTQISRSHAFPADDTSVPANYENRLWILRGVDYNILFDKRVLRNTSNYLKHPPSISGSTMDGTALSNMLDNYVDVPSGFNFTTEMDDIVSVKPGGGGSWAYVQQGTKIREQFEQLSLRSAAVYYIDADKDFHYHSVETQESRWGFSDDPNYNTITTSPAEFQDATYGFREVEATEDGSGIVNDALIWGGSEWVGSGGTVFAREEDTSSQSTHGRWQVGEVHFGEQGFGIQAGVDARAEAIVSGPPGADAYGQLKGLRFNQWSFRFAWHDKDVPDISGVKDHLRPGQLVTINLAVFDETHLLPLRSLRISFPELDPTEGGDPFVRFDGEFGLQLTDPFTIWRYLLRRGTPAATGGNLVIASVNNDDTVTAYGAYYQGEPSPAPDDNQEVFTIPFGYVTGTVEVYDDGVLQTEGTDWTATDPESGEITFTTPPTSGSVLWVVARTLPNAIPPPAEPGEPPPGGSLTNTTPPTPPAIPALLTPMTETEWPDIQVTRISNVHGQRNQYSRMAGWNSDQTLILLGATDIQSIPAIHDGATYAKLYNQAVLPGYSQWANTNPNRIYGTYPSDNRLLWIAPGSSTIQVDHTFSAYDEVSLGDGEGGLSDDDQTVVLMTRSGSDNGMLLFDRSTHTVIAEHDFGSDRPDTCFVSRGGNYALVYWSVQPTPDGPGAQQGLWQYDRDLNVVRQLTEYARHGDVCRLADGTEAWGQVAFGGEVYNLDTGAKTDLLGGTNNAFTLGHFSGRATSRNGYAVMSVYDYPASFTGSDYGKDQIIGVALDGSGDIEVYGWSYHRNDGQSGSNYPTSPFAVPNRDGDKVLFGSEWGDTAPYGAVYAYIAERIP